MPKSKLSAREQIILGVFSFYEPMTFSKVIMDLDQVMIKDLGDFSKEDLEQTIKSLEQKGFIKGSMIDKETSWIRLHPRKPWWRRLFSL